MAIDDFEWEGEVTRAALEVEPAKPEAKPGLWARLKQSVWLEPALKLGGMGALLGVLAGIGVVATTYAKPGVALPEGPRAVAAVLGTSWLKPVPPAPSEHAAAPVAASASAPAVGEAKPPEAPAETAPSPGPTPVGITPEGKVILNAASADELTKLPGVGMKRAQAIVALRTKLKRFKSPTDLLRVKGIGPRGLQRMLPHLVLDGAAPSSS
jgi:competence protein ComEA